MKGLFSLIIFFLLSFSLSKGSFLYAKEDSLFVKVVGDTVQIWNTDVTANCASQFTFSMLILDSNIIVITEIDTIGPIADCICNFNLHFSLTGLSPGQYTVSVYRQELKKYFYSKDTTIFIGELTFTLENSSTISHSSYLYQGECKPFSEQTFTARYWFADANSACQEIRTGAKILNINSEDVSFDGNSETWNYKYFWYDQPSSRVEYIYFHNDQNQVLFDSLSLIMICCVMYITEDWIDSDSALAYAEACGGKTFREENPDYIISASLSQALTPYSYPCWSVIYFSRTDSSKKFFIHFDARKIITGADFTSPLPEEFLLEQNYPNPFNPVTKIKYSIPAVETGHAPSLQQVKLKIYDLLGREIATLVNEEKAPGEYEVEFSAGSFGDGSNLSSGIYFYVLSVGGKLFSKKMSLIK